VVDNTLTGGHSGAYDDPDGTTNGVKAAKLTNSSITGNTISNCGAGVSLVARENSINNVIINNNNISNIRSSGVVINNAADAITGLTFAVDNVTVQSNTISSCAANGIYVEGLAPAGTRWHPLAP
jgi:malic enzyme